MPINLDYVGLNTLIQEPVTDSQNTIGFSEHYRPSKVLRMPATSNTIKGITGTVQSTYPATSYISFSFWTKFDSDSSSDSRYIVATTNSSNQDGIFIMINTSNDFRVLLYNTSANLQAYDSSPISNLSNWNHWVVTINISNLATVPEVYQNGVALSALSDVGGTGTGTVTPINKIQLMGNDSDSSTVELQGSLQHLAVFTGQLNQEEVTIAYNSKDLSESSLSSKIIDYWRLGEEKEFADFSIGTAVTNGLSFAATVGSTVLTIDENIVMAQGYHSIPKNINNRLGVIKTSNYLTALNIHRNGPYGWPAFNSTKISHNPLTRYQNKNSIFSYTIDGGMRTVTQNGKLRDRFRERRGALKQIIESPIYSNHKPLKLLAIAEGEEVEVLVSPGNETQYFGDQQANRDHNTFDKSPNEFGEMLKLYKTKRPERSPIDAVVKLDYSQTIFPKAENSGLNRIRKRETFQNNFWRDNFIDRESTSVFLNHNDGMSGSIWPLDTVGRRNSNPNFVASTYYLLNSPSEPYLSSHRNGVLMHDLSKRLIRNFFDFSYDSATFDLSGFFVPLPKYSLSDRAIVSSSFNYHKNKESNRDRGEGYWKYSQPWTAAEESGKKPFYDSYSDFSELIRHIGNDYSIIPEFRISPFVEEILSKGIRKVDYLNKFLTLTGSNTGSSGEFFKIFTTSELLKNFDVIQEENDSVIKPSNITLRCKAIKKLLPYNSFYPVNRTIDLHKSFLKNYKDQISNNNLHGSLTDDYNSGSLSAVTAPLFAPGILYNTIKSGLAVDYPIPTSGSNASNYIDLRKGIKFNYGYVNKTGRDLGHISTNYSPLPGAGVSSRVPFEAILKPSEILQNHDLTLLAAEFQSTGDIIEVLKSSVSGDDKLDYSMIVNNFLAETNEFFMKNKNFTTIASLPEGDPNFGNAIAGRTYKMRLKMYRTITGSKNPLIKNGIEYFYPQDSGSVHETFNMYSNPHGFTQHYAISFEKKLNEIKQWSSFQKEGLRETYYPGTYDFRTPQYNSSTDYRDLDHFYNASKSHISASYSGSFYSFGNFPYAGLNYPGTPPYYHGEAWADITFRATETKKHSLSEILNNSSIEFLRHYDHNQFFDKSKVGKISGSAITVTNASAIHSAAPTSYPFSTVPQEIRFFIPFEFQSSQYATGSSDTTPPNLSGSYHSIAFIQGSIANPTTSSIFIDTTGLSNSQLAEKIALAINGSSSSGITHPASSADNNFATGIPSLYASAVGGKVMFETNGFLDYKGKEYSRLLNAHSGFHVPYGGNILGELFLQTIDPFDASPNNNDKTAYFPYSPELYTSSSISRSNLTITQTNVGSTFYSDSTATGRSHTTARGLDAHRFPINGYINSHLCNETAMQLASSVNLLSKGILTDKPGETSNVADNYRWIIQTKFETPMLNFRHINPVAIERTSSLTAGMWHQYGRIPDNKDGVYLKVEDVPSGWIQAILGGSPEKTGSLSELCGFTNEAVKLGQLKETKVIKEAVVAIPFVERAGERKFFKLDRKDIKAALKEETGLIGQSVIDQIQRMQEYVFPPSMDFLRNQDIDPFAMYIFEFTHTLSKQDLADIWQGLLPDIGRNHETAEATISHELLAHELLGSGAKYLPNKDGKFVGLDRNAREPFIEPDIQWMVFKVKKRAASNYFEKIFERNESNLGDKTKLDELSATSTGANLGVQYNWPYDFFSLVELVKIDAEVEFANATTTDEGTRIEPVKIKKE